jgi:hypothetical protein
MWIEDADSYGKIVTWGTTGNVAVILQEAIRYAETNDWTIKDVSTHMGTSYDDKLVTVRFD